MKIIIHIPTQTLELFDDSGKLLCCYAVSTGANGVGEENGSFCTPRGKQIYTPQLGALHPGRDWILTRILWLCGKEPGYNRLGSCDTMRRYIYIHGTPDSAVLGKPGSHGCVRMRNAGLLELFEQIQVGTSVDILA